MTDAPIVFIASIAPLQTAISIASDGGARVRLDIPETELDEIMALMRMRGKTLIVTVQESEEILSHGNKTGAEANNRAARSPTAMARSRVQRPTD